MIHPAADVGLVNHQRPRSARVFGGVQLLDDERPEMRLMFPPIGEATVVETWDSLSLRATASHDFVVADRFVPAERSCWFSDAPVRPERIYRLSAIAFFAACIASIALGIARHADELSASMARQEADMVPSALAGTGLRANGNGSGRTRSARAHLDAAVGSA